MVIPQASDDNLQSDKQKAYEQQLLEQRDEEKRNNLTSLSDYWDKENMQNDNRGITDNAAHGSHNNSIQSYKAAQQTLGFFYGRDNQEVSHLQRRFHDSEMNFCKRTCPVSNLRSTISFS
ncbi:hypothetical protein [Chryseobacterium sp. R2ACT005]|uniref:hypothetical protein n=1 Tax=Chryseobacterium sp. R2ACT005 TaxID=3416668 RepID=UPI003CEAC67C